MTNKQLLLLIATTTALALVLAWIIERTQVQRFVTEFDEWWTHREGASGGSGTGAE